MSNADRFVSMALDDVIKYRRKEGGRGGFRRGARGARGGPNMQGNPPQRGMRGGGMRGQRGFPQRFPGGRIAKNRPQGPGPRQPMPNFRGNRGGPRGGFVPRGRGRGNMQPHFNPRLGLTTGNNQMPPAGRMRAWTSDRPQQMQQMPMPNMPPRGRGRGGMRGAMRGSRGGLRSQRGPPPPQWQEEFHMQPMQMQLPPQQMQQPRMQRVQQPRMQLRQQQQQPRFTQANQNNQMAQQLKTTTQTARNRVRLAAQVLMQRKRQLEQLEGLEAPVFQQTAVVTRQAGLKTRGARLRGTAVRGVAAQRVTGVRRGGGVVKRVDARTAIKQKIVRASVNRQRALQRAQNQQLEVNIGNEHKHQQMMMPMGPPQRLRPMPGRGRGLAQAAVRRAAAFRRNQVHQQGQMGPGGYGPPMGHHQRQLTLHERFSNQTW